MDDKLTGALIGLARATDASEYLITPEATVLILRCYSEPDAPGLLEMVDAEKRRIVPNCYTCACPCGRTEAYDMAKLRTAPADIRNRKLALLESVRKLAAGSPLDKNAELLLYRALIAVGADDCTAEWLQSVLDTLMAQNRR